MGGGVSFPWSSRTLRQRPLGHRKYPLPEWFSLRDRFRADFSVLFPVAQSQSSAAFFGGILVVLFGWPILGMAVEAYGFIVLFSGFFPVAINFLRRIPVIGTLLNLPVISTIAVQLGGEDPMGHDSGA